MARVGRTIKVLAAVLCVFAISFSAGAQCSATCEFTSIPSTIALGDTAEIVIELMWSNCPSTNSYIDFGDGESQPLSYGTNYVYHDWKAAGGKAVRIVVEDYNNPGIIYCQKMASVNVEPCNLSPCTVTVGDIVKGSSWANVFFNIASPATWCSSEYNIVAEVTPWPGATPYNVSLDHNHGPGPFSVMITYTPEHFDSFPVVFRMHAGHTQDYPDEQECTSSCSLDLAPPKPCLNVGSYLKFCADTISPPQNGDEYTLSGHVCINGTLWCSGDMKFKGDPASGLGTLTTDGTLTVKLASADTPILSGPVSFTVDGEAASITPVHDPSKPFFSFTLQGVKLYQMDLSWQFRTAGLILKPWLEIGNNLVDFRLALVELELILPPGGSIQIQSSEVIAGSFQPDYKVSHGHLTYDGLADELEGLIEMNAPALGTWTLWTSLWTFDGCIDRGYAGSPWPLDLPLGSGKLGLADGTLALMNICNGTSQEPKFKALLGGRFQEWVFSAFFVDAAEAVIEPLRADAAILRVRSGELEIYTSHVDLRSGLIVISKLPRFDFTSGAGALKVDPFLNGEMSRISFMPDEHPSYQRAYFHGTYKGSVAIPQDFQSNLSSGPEIKALLDYWSKGDYPYVLNGRSLQLSGEVDAESHYPRFEGTLQIGGLPISFYLIASVSAGKWQVKLLTGNLIPASRTSGAASSEDAVERSFTIDNQRDWGMFSVSGQSSVPVIYLKSPSGERITPATAAAFPGVTYLSSSNERLASFLVQACPAGTWVLGEENLPESEVTFRALGASQPPQAAISEVTQSGETVAIHATFTPPTPEAKVTLFYATSPDGTPSGVIAGSLPASSGTVQATWDTTLVPNGSYYIVAQGDDGTNPIVTAVRPEPVVVSHGGPGAPSGLAGTFDAGVATLHWTPSPDTSVVGYLVLYSDQPSLPGYTSESAASGTDTAIIEDLDLSRNYRFSVVAYDEAGNRSAESASWTTSVCALRAAPTCSPTVGVGQVATFAANAVADHCTSALAYDWNFGDGSAHSDLETPTHSYAAAGTYTWTLTASSGDRAANGTGNIFVSEQQACALTCSATVPTSGKTGEAVAFAAAGAAEGCMGDVAYAWDFGDGSPAGTAANESHKYSSAGTFHWVLTATLGGNRCVKTGMLTVVPGLPGDCDGDGAVSIGEVQKAINMFLGIEPPACGVDCNGDGSVSIGEVQKVINGFLGNPGSC